MSVSIDLYEVASDGEIIVDFFEDDLEDKRYADLLEHFKDKIEVSSELVYDIESALKEKGYKIEDIRISDYYVNEEGWSFWVDDKITIPLKDIPSEEAKKYTLRGKCLRGLDSGVTKKYKSEMYKNNKAFIHTKEDFEHYISMAYKKSDVSKIQWFDGLVISNSY